MLIIPTSLLNSDAKVLILAKRLNEVILTLVHEDQFGFMLGKGTDINLQRLYTVLASGNGEDWTVMVASLDAEKAFDDSVEWEYLWEVLHRFGFRSVFISLVEALYRSPTARVLLSPLPFRFIGGLNRGAPSPQGFLLWRLNPSPSYCALHPRSEE